MFKCRKKKIERENSIVDYIIQTYADVYSADSKLLCFIDENTESEDEKNKILASLDKYNTLLYECSIFDEFKKQLFRANKHLPILTHLELSVCFLVNTKMYYPEAIIDALWIDKKRLRQVVQSLEAKIAEGGYKLPKGYKAMQQHLHSFCKSANADKK